MHVAVFCMDSDELKCVYEDMRMMLEQASQEMYVMSGSGDEIIRCSIESYISWKTCEAGAADDADTARPCNITR